MKNKTPVVSTAVEKNVNIFLSRLKKTIDKLDEGSLTFHYGGRPVRAQKIDIIRVISSLTPRDKIDLAIRNIILEAVMTSESLSAGSGYFLVKSLFNKKQITLKTQRNSDIKDILEILTQMMGEGLSKKIVYSIITESSIDSEVSLSSSEMAYAPVITVNSSLELDGSLSEMFSTQRKRIENSAILFVDGVIESLGMIDSILQSFSVSKKSLVILARGYSIDVANTLNENYRAGNLYVFPVKVPERDETFLEVESHKNFFNFENIHLLRTMNSDDFDHEYDIDFDGQKIRIGGLSSIKRKSHVTLPSHYRNVLGLLQDRINLGKRIAMEAAMTGIAKDKNSNSCMSVRSAKQSFKSHRSLLSSLENLGAFVLQT